MSDEIRYVYAVGRAGPSLDEAAAGSTGQDGAPVRAVRCGQLGALVSAVSADRFGEEGLTAQLEDLERLEAVARAHDTVVAEAYRVTTVLPMRLGTLCLDDARVGDLLTDRAEEFRVLLERLEGQAEWGVKIYADPRHGTPAPAAVPGGDGSRPAAGAGRDYLRQRRAHREHRRDAQRTAEAVVARVAEAAASRATDRVAHRPQSGDLATGPGENVANDAYLVPVEHAQAFHDAVARAAGDPSSGVRVDITGPWAPYSFASPHEGHAS